MRDRGREGGREEGREGEGGREEGRERGRKGEREEGERGRGMEEERGREGEIKSGIWYLLQACRGSVELTVRHMTRGHTSLPPPPDHTDTPPASYGQHYSEFSNSSSARGEETYCTYLNLYTKTQHGYCRLNCVDQITSRVVLTCAMLVSFQDLVGARSHMDLMDKTLSPPLPHLIVEVGEALLLYRKTHHWRR